MRFSIENRNGYFSFVQDGEEKGYALGMEFEADQTTGSIELASVMVREREVLGQNLGPFEVGYETVTGKKPPVVPQHPRIKVVR